MEFATRNNQRSQNCESNNIKLSAARVILLIAANNVTDYLDDIALKPKLYLTNQKDDCVFKLIDTLRYNSVLGSGRSLEVLGYLYRNSDGEISEYFDEIGVEIFYIRFDVFAGYGCSNFRSLPALILLLKVAPRVLVRCSMSFSVKGVRKQFFI